MVEASRLLLICAALLPFMISASPSPDAGNAYDTWPPFAFTQLTSAGNDTYNPRNPYNILINYELGMHCVGFDMSYCCIIPPYNSIQAQAVRSGSAGARPLLLSPTDDIKLAYSVRDNSYSEGNKMKYWQVLKDVSGSGMMVQPRR